MAKRKGKILLVDDDPDLLRLLSLRLNSANYETVAVESGREALARLEMERPQLVITDLRMEGMDGLALFDNIHRRHPALPVIMLTAHGSIPDAVSATKRGMFGFLTKPFDGRELLEQVDKAFALTGAGTEPGESADDSAWRADIITRSPLMEELLSQARLVAESQASVLIHGESGTGKELLAKAIHRASPRRDQAFVAFNCAAIPETLLETELFGHEKGAFTGAVARRVGKFEEADGGTLLLDEVTEMEPRLQAKLLRAIQEKEIDRLGGKKPIKVDVRIIATSNRNMEKAVAEKAFREDLYFRLNVMTINVPELKDRPGDLELLSRHFVEKYTEANGLGPLELTREAVAKLTGYSWPGNVRELENIIHRSVLLASGDEIGADDVQLPVSPGAGVPRNGGAGAEGGTHGLVGRTVAEVERDLIIDTLQHCLGNRTHAANILGISIRTLRNKLRAYNEEGFAVPKPGEAEASVL